MKHLISAVSYVHVLSFWSRFVFIISPHTQAKSISRAGWASTTAHKPCNHRTKQHRPPCSSSDVCFFPPTPSASVNKQKNPNFFLPLPQVQNAPGTSPPAVESSSRPAFQRSTPTTWTAHSWSLLLRCRRSFWSSRASNWSRTHSLPLECPAATTAWRFGTVSLEVSLTIKTIRMSETKDHLVGWCLSIYSQKTGNNILG